MGLYVPDVGAGAAAGPCSRGPADSAERELSRVVFWMGEIAVWAKTVHPLRYRGGGLTPAGAVESINVLQDYRGGKRIDYWIIRELLLAGPQRLAIVELHE